MRQLETEDEHATQVLITRISIRAEGVFLWASFAVQDVLAGLVKGDSLKILGKRLDLMADSLADLFLQRLQAIDKVHRKQAAAHLSVVVKVASRRTNVKKLNVPFIAFCCHSDLAGVLHGALEHKNPPTQEVQKLHTRLEELTVALKWQSAGLLDVRKHRCYSSQTELDRTCINFYCDDGRRYPAKSSLLGRVCLHHYLHTSVNLIHRSVIDFLTEDPRAIEFMKGSVCSDGMLNENLAESVSPCARMLFCMVIELKRLEVDTKKGTLKKTCAHIPSDMYFECVDPT